MEEHKGSLLHGTGKVQHTGDVCTDRQEVGDLVRMDHRVGHGHMDRQDEEVPCGTVADHGDKGPHGVVEEVL